MFTRHKTLVIRQRLRALVRKEAQKLAHPRCNGLYRDNIYNWPERQCRRVVKYTLVGPCDDYSHVDRYHNHYMKEVRSITVEIPESERIKQIQEWIYPNEGKNHRRRWKDCYWDYNEVREKERAIADTQFDYQDFEDYMMAVTD